jgi:NAD+ diphosphatase
VTPAVIVAVTDGERILLGHNAAFQRGFYSAFAGFVEPGETLEEACQREVREKSGVEISDLRYFASQHWPFPGNLMIAFTARYAGGEVSADGIELTDVRWFTRDDPPPGMPGPGGMGRALYDWFMQGGAR